MSPRTSRLRISLDGSLRGLVVAIAVLANCSCGDSGAREQLDQERRPKIVFVEDSTQLPLEWRKAPNIKVGAIANNERMKVQGLLKSILDNYPDGFVVKHLAHIYAYKWLSLDGFDYLGTYELPASVHIALPDDMHPAWYEHTLHEEISSLLYHKYAKLVRSAGLEYGQGKPPNLAGDLSLARDETALRKGYLNRYAMSSPEQDFNAMAAALMSGNGHAWLDAMEYEALGKKYERVIKFYGALDKRFTRDYFRRLLKP